MHREITECRVCGNPVLAPILRLGNQCLTGIFLKTPDQGVARSPIELMKCHGQDGEDYCGLVQSRYNYDLRVLYGGDYGYRSGLNGSMVNHLAGIAAEVSRTVSPGPGDIVVDIGSNDGTLLSFYTAEGVELAGFDPTAERFAKYYKPHIRRVVDFFSASRFRELYGDRKAKAVTSIAMFYDLERPMDFMRQIAEVLSDDGIWHFEQSYLPSMMAANAYDTACHEHLEYYALRQIKFMADRAGLKVIDVKFNDVNGGSFAVTAAKNGARLAAKTAVIQDILDEEERRGFSSLAVYEQFQRDVFAHRDALLSLLRRLKTEGRLVLGYGASTKGNVMLQFCGITAELLPFIAEVNEEKFGCYTPGTLIPIIPENQARGMNPEYFLVFPWHFRRNILQRETEYLRDGGKFIFPLPHLEIVGQ
jgi:hypothetical protein